MPSVNNPSGSKEVATIHLTEANFDTTIDNNDMVVVDFWAPWCGPCKAFGPIFEKVSEKHPDVVFGKLNTDEEQALAGSFQIRSIPTLMIFRQKIMIFSQPGMLPEPTFADLIDKAKAVDMEQVRQEIANQKKS